MHNPLIRKLKSFADLGSQEIAALTEISRSTFTGVAGQYLIKEGDRPEDVFMLLEGWACRLKVTQQGDQQIMAYLIPDDLCDPHVLILDEMDHSIVLLSNARFARIPKQVILDLTKRFPVISRALWWSTLVDVATLREWLVNLGQRDAYQRLTHLFCELWVRMCKVDLTVDGSSTCPLPKSSLPLRSE